MGLKRITTPMKGTKVSKAKGKPKTKAVASKAKAKAQDRVIWTTRPPLPEPCSGTTYYLQGKLHRNTAVFRVFRKASDRVDLKVKVDPEPSVAWSRCLDIIEEAAKKEEKKATEPDDSKDVD